jgi:L,D-transpeptidase catalytic domain
MSGHARAAILSAVSFLILISATAPALAQKVPTAVPVKTEITALEPPKVVRTIVVSLKDRRLALLENGLVKAVYPVAVGKASTPSPTGRFTVVTHVINPTYYHHGVVIPPGPENPVGNRWMGLSVAGYGIHGTNVPRSIGKAASHGCIRMSRRDLDKLFAQVRVGDTVEIVGERDEETAAIFGEPPAPRGAAAPALVLAVKAERETSPAKPAPVTVAMAATVPVGQ